MTDSADMRKIAEGLSQPGIDPRSFVSLAIITKISVEASGIYCDVTLLPSGIIEHATYSPMYGGTSYGLHAPFEVDELVVVVAPEGDPAHGLRIVGSTWDGGEPPPHDVVDNPSDFVLVVKKDKNCRIIVDGAGDVIVEARGTGVVRLGGPSADGDVVVQGALDVFGAAINAAMAVADLVPDPVAVTTLGYLRTALGIDPVTGMGWVAGTTKTKAE